MASTDRDTDPETTRASMMDPEVLAGRRLFERLRRYEDNPMATAISKDTGPINPALLTALYARNDALVHRLVALSRRDAALAAREHHAAQEALAALSTDADDLDQFARTTEEEEIVAGLEAGMARREAAMACIESTLMTRRTGGRPPPQSQ